jgi:hypothetical protein
MLILMFLLEYCAYKYYITNIRGKHRDNKELNLSYCFPSFKQPTNTIFYEYCV